MDAARMPVLSGLQKNAHFRKVLSVPVEASAASHHVVLETSAYAAMLRNCGINRTLSEGIRIHASLAIIGHDRQTFLGNLLVQMYGNCGRLQEARAAFNNILTRNVFSYSILISAYVRNGDGFDAIGVFRRMEQEGIHPDAVAFVGVVGAFCLLSDCWSLTEAKQLHSRILSCGLTSNVTLGNAVIQMFRKYKSLRDAKSVFDGMQHRDVVSWNAMIASYIEFGCKEDAIQLYGLMQKENVDADAITFASLVGAVETIEEGKWIHRCICNCGFGFDVFVCNSLIYMYAKCDSIEDARHVFDNMSCKDVVTWNIMIAAYGEKEEGKQAFGVFQAMKYESGFAADQVSYVNALSGCAIAGALEEGKQVHAEILAAGDEFTDDIVIANSLLSMYGKCGDVDAAVGIFNGIRCRDLISWNGIVSVLIQQGQYKEAVEYYRKMDLDGVKPDSTSFGSVLNACAGIGALSHGKILHQRVIECGLELHEIVGNSLIHMYGKCGRCDDARQVFDKLQLTQNLRSDDIVPWNSMIAAYAHHGYGYEALELFKEMDVPPDEITFSSVLRACSHSGLVRQGCMYFGSMTSDHGVIPVLEHYLLVIDLLGRVGRLEEAEEFMKNRMPFPPDVVAWRTLLGAASIHGDVPRGARAADEIMKLEPEASGSYVLLSNIYSAVQRWDDTKKVRRKMRSKTAGWSWIEVKNKVHEFFSDDKHHPQKQQIEMVLKDLTKQIEAVGYLPVLHDVEEEEKESMLCYHSEKLAIAFGIMKTVQGSPLHIVKNLRVCSDCHSATKFISIVTKRQIIVRDSSRFHQFENGLCSCKDYW